MHFNPKISAFVVITVPYLHFSYHFFPRRESANVLFATVLTIHGGMCLSDAVEIVLARILPDDAHVRCNHRLGVWVTHVPTLSDECIRTFASKQELVRWLSTSCHSICTSHTPTRGAYMDGMVFRYGRHAVEQPTLFVAIHDLPTDVHPFHASESIVRLVEQGVADAQQLLAHPRSCPRLFRWMPAVVVASPLRRRSLRCYIETLCYWVEWATMRGGARGREAGRARTTRPTSPAVGPR